MKPCVLVIAGSDSSGGAGVAADRDALSDYEVEPSFVVTAWTHQDRSGVRALGAVDASEWLTRAREAVSEAGAGLGAVKFGLLPGGDAIRAAGELLAELRRERGAELPIVIDPVIASSSGHRFLDSGDIALLLEELLPLGLVWTPNLFEAATLTGHDLEALVANIEQRDLAARALVAGGARGVVLKGGHGLEDPAVDLIVESGGSVRLHHARLAGASVRGSGCRFASALAGGLAMRESLELAARGAGALVLERLLRSGGGGG